MRPPSVLLRAATALAAVALGSTAAGEEAPVSTNRLAQETSPYLLQHAHNPVDWYPWGEEAFARARAEDRPIFLSVGYSTCHWCHVMERESFEDPEVAAVLNRHFVAIKVDREELPDVDDLYMTAVQLMTGHGGWPMSAWLTPDRKPFFGGTYYPKPQFLTLLERIAAAWREERDALVAQADRVTLAVASLRGTAASARALTDEPLRQAVAAAGSRFDERRGGFGGAPKFPNETNLLLLLGRYERAGDAEALRMAALTLRRMARGGIYDHVGGGFHRYSTDADWLVPHFEKMLYNQAWLGRAYLEAWRLTGEPLFLSTLRETLAYVQRDMASPEGAFYTAEDADSEGEEGRFYVWTPAQIRSALPGEGEADLFAAYYGVTEPGNFEHGRSILHVDQPLDEFARGRGADPEALRRGLDEMRARLLAVRAGRERPLRDDKVLCGWNGMMIATFARAGAYLEDPSYVRAAERAADFVWAKLRDGSGRLLRVYRAGRARVPAYQEDYAYLIDGLLEIHAAAGGAGRLAQARQLADEMIARFWDEEGGGFYATGGDHDRLLSRAKDSYDGAVPSGNAVAVHDLVRLARYTGEAGYREKAERTLGAFAEAVSASPLAYTYLLLAADSLWNGEAGPRSDDPRGVLTARLQPAGPWAGSGREVPFTLRLRIRDGWHINSNLPAGDLLIPTEIAVDGVGLPVRLGGADYPAGERLRLPFADEPLSVYRGEVEIRGRLLLGDGRPGAGLARLRLRYQACDDEKCLPPETLPLSIPLRIGPAAGGAVGG
jgi:hypothetical protein